MSWESWDAGNQQKEETKQSKTPSASRRGHGVTGTQRTQMTENVIKHTKKRN